MKFKLSLVVCCIAPYVPTDAGSFCGEYQYRDGLNVCQDCHALCGFRCTGPNEEDCTFDETTSSFPPVTTPTITPTTTESILTTTQTTTAVSTTSHEPVYDGDFGCEPVGGGK